MKKLNKTELYEELMALAIKNGFSRADAACVAMEMVTNGLTLLPKSVGKPGLFELEEEE